VARWSSGATGAEPAGSVDSVASNVETATDEEIFALIDSQL
jgi:hypothetical protein